MTAQFPPLPVERLSRPDWPRLMRESDAAAYLSIGTTLLRDLLPPKKIRGRSVWDRRDLDRLADGLDGQPLDESGLAAQSKAVERAWLEQRAKRRGRP